MNRSSGSKADIQRRQTFSDVSAMSALPPKADIRQRDLSFDPLMRTDRVELIEHRQDVLNVFGIWIRFIKGIEEPAVVRI
jgi:hypothetical protein